MGLQSPQTRKYIVDQWLKSDSTRSQTVYPCLPHWISWLPSDMGLVQFLNLLTLLHLVRFLVHLKLLPIWSASRNMCMCVYSCIHIYIYMNVKYIYVYVQEELNVEKHWSSGMENAHCGTTGQSTFPHDPIYPNTRIISLHTVAPSSLQAPRKLNHDNANC